MNSLLESRKTSRKNYPRLLSCLVTAMFSPKDWQYIFQERLEELALFMKGS